MLCGPAQLNFSLRNRQLTTVQFVYPEQGTCELLPTALVSPECSPWLRDPI
jgi:hypothetical protein